MTMITLPELVDAPVFVSYNVAPPSTVPDSRFARSENV
jgi:hypothetical protein